MAAGSFIKNATGRSLESGRNVVATAAVELENGTFLDPKNKAHAKQLRRWGYSLRDFGYNGIAVSPSHAAATQNADNDGDILAYTRNTNGTETALRYPFANALSLQTLYPHGHKFTPEEKYTQNVESMQGSGFSRPKHRNTLIVYVMIKILSLKLILTGRLQKIPDGEQKVLEWILSVNLPI